MSDRPWGDRPLERSDVLAKDQVADLLGLKPSTIDDLRRRGDLAAVHRPSRRINALGLRIDQVVYRLYGLSDAEASRVERGHDPPPGVSVQSDP